jgi:hypothetical protein
MPLVDAQRKSCVLKRRRNFFAILRLMPFAESPNLNDLSKRFICNLAFLRRERKSPQFDLFWDVVISFKNGEQHLLKFDSTFVEIFIQNVPTIADSAQ